MGTNYDSCETDPLNGKSKMLSMNSIIVINRSRVGFVRVCIVLYVRHTIWKEKKNLSEF